MPVLLDHEEHQEDQRVVHHVAHAVAVVVVLVVLSLVVNEYVVTVSSACGTSEAHPHGRCGHDDCMVDPCDKRDNRNQHLDRLETA